MAKTKQGFTEQEFDALQKRAQKDPAVAANLTRYARHVTRIHTLRRVLDPKDKKAKLLQGTPDTVNAELLRREADLPRLEKELRAALA